MAISEPFAKVLSSGRGQFNQRVTEARRRFPAFDTESLADFLRSGVDRVVLAVAETVPERVAPTALVAYDIALELVGMALAGPKARHSLVNRVWLDVLPSYARLAAEHPVEVIASLSNAAVNIGKVSNTRSEPWLREMCALSSQVESLAQLQGVGQILAWRCGMAHYRLGAIHAADLLPEHLALAAVGSQANASWAHTKEQLLANPWWTPNGTSGLANHPGTEVGQFTGFAGDFPEPPEVHACPEGFFVKSGDCYRLLIADAFGAVLHAATPEEFEEGSGHRFTQAVTLKKNRLVIGSREIELDLPTGYFSVAHNSHTVAVTSPLTHAIRLLPLQ